MTGRHAGGSVAGDYKAKLAPWSDIQGHMKFLKDTAAGFGKPVIIELGVRSGNSTAAFLHGTSRNNGQVWSVDIVPPDVPHRWHDLIRWHFLQADDISDQAREWLPELCDVLFIDSSHDQGHVHRQLQLYARRVRAGGVILLHDTEYLPEGDQMLDEPGGPVTAALNAWCEETGRSWVNRTGSYGLGAVRC